jgi:myo-inositol-1(or 4)-monophosphatase
VSTSGSTGGPSDTAEELHEFVCDVARRAGDLQLSRYENPGEVTEKAPKDVVTEVDLLCEELMVGAISERYPEDAILSEERGGTVSETGRTWLLDPVDGTANYMKANPMFCACVAVLENGTVTHAAVAAPRLGDLYHASLGGGAYRDTGGRRSPLRVSATDRLGYAVVGADLSLYGGREQPPGAGGPLRLLAASGSGERRHPGSLDRRGLPRPLRRDAQHRLGLRPDRSPRLGGRGPRDRSLR